MNASLSDSAAVSPWTIVVLVDVVLGRRLVGKGRTEAFEEALEALRCGSLRIARTSSSWTAVEVCVIGMSPPSGSSGPLGLPGRRSRKKFPSRKRRGRISTSRVAVDRQALVLDGERHLRRVAFRLDVGDLAHVDAGDPHRSGLAQRGGVLEGRASACSPGRSTGSFLV